MHAQSATPPPASSTTTTTSATPSSVTTTTAAGAESENVTTLEKFTVSDVPVTEQILPTVRPIGSVYGEDADVLDIPRSVSSVNKAWMDDRQIKNSMDLGQFSPGVYSEALYGIPGVPEIRGDEGQFYIDGQLIPFSRNSVPLSFNGVEAMDIVKGPGTAVYGPQGNGPGGYVNFVSKQPYFDRMHFDISMTAGDWASGHSYGNPEYTIDFGGPISDTLAFRVSYLARYGDEYYLNAKNETQDVYAALTYLPFKKLKIEWWGQGYSDRTNEITGTNRVTQNFIWSGDYIGGPTVVATTGPIAYYGYDTYLPGDGNPATNYPSGSDGAYQIVDPNKAYHVKLPGYDALVGPDDTARAKLFHSQLKETLDLGPDIFVVNQSYFSLESSNKFETYGYDEYVPRSQMLENRTELHDSFDIGKISNSLITGIDIRYDYVRDYTDYTMEPFTYYDLYQPLSGVFYPGYNIQNNTWGSGLQIPGKAGYSAGEEQDTQIYDYAAFIQDTVKLNNHLSSIIGFREDAISANTANPPMVEAGINPNNSSSDYNMPFLTYNGYYSLANPEFLDRGALWAYHGAALDPSYFTSIIYKFNDTQSVYVTYDRVNAIHGSTNFGGIDDGYKGPDTIKEDIKTSSTLYEAGYKGSYLHNTLYVGVSVYQQLKTEDQLKGPPFLVKTNGYEFEAVYQPTKALSINANVTYQQATAFGTSFFEETGNYLDAYSTTTPVDGTFGTGYGAVNYGAYQGYGYSPPNGRMRAPGVPDLLANFFFDYKITRAWSFGAGPSFIGRQYANDEDTLHIPGEYEVDAHLTFAPSKRWDVRVNVTNLFNHRLLDPIDVNFAGNDTIFVRPPISASLTIRLHY